MKRTKHNLGHTHLLTCDMGKLIPIGCVEALPGDTFQHNASALIRVSPLAAPVMHPITARIHHFFVPNRLLWGGWEDFITGGPDGMNADVIPKVSSDVTTNGLQDYLGIPRVAGVDFSELPIRAYNMIYNEYYRDQDLSDSRFLYEQDIANIAWEKDYFTSARPWTQKGPDVTIPIGDRATIRHGAQETDALGVFSDVADEFRTMHVDGNVSLHPGAFPSNADESLYADLSNVVGGNVNDVRRAFAIQRYQEARARYGSRYTEYLRYLGVNPKDSRLQRPEYLGGGQTQINFSEVLQTAPEQTGQQPTTEFGVGDMYGHGIGAMRSNRYRRFIEEHGFVVSMLSVRPKAIYSNGIHRSFLRSYKEDFYQKELQFIGQQEVFNNEVYVDPIAGTETFGYQDRYSEYREQPSHVSGEFRDILDYWHMARQFNTPPVLNNSFVECVPTKRIHNEQTHHSLWVQVQHKMVVRRLLSKNTGSKIF